MAAGTITVHEYETMAQDARGYPVPVGQEPQLAAQTNLSDGTSDPFTAFNALTTFVMVKCVSGAVSIRFGDSLGSTPTAVVSGTAFNMKMVADETLYFGVHGGQIMAIITD